MKVWVLLWRDYDDSGVVGVYATEERARAGVPAGVRWEQTWGGGDRAPGPDRDYTVEEHEVKMD